VSRFRIKKNTAQSNQFKNSPHHTGKFQKLHKIQVKIEVNVVRSRIFLLFVLCLVCLFSAHAQTVSEAESSVVLNDKTADVSIVVENSAKSFGSRIELEILDAESKIRARAGENVEIKKGRETYRLSLPLGDLMRDGETELPWFRLHYRVGQTEGFASLSELVRDIFELRVAAGENVAAGTNYRVQIRAVQPFTKLPVRNVKIDAEIRLEIETDADEDEIKLTAKGETDGEGLLTLDFKIPENIKIEYGSDFKITGRKNGVVRQIDEDIDSSDSRGSISLMADKPIYQPGQTFSVRGLYLDENGTVVTGDEIKFSVKDVEGTVLYRETVKTSAFGVAAISWKIPDGAKLGFYTVEADTDESLWQNSLNFKVSRYDLPNFSVAAAPDKSFYLPADKEAEIAVNAMYLFGKPVTRGKVRLVQESERHWNYKEQKYDVEEEQAFEGETDAEGKYVAKVDLTKATAALASDGWKRFEDLRFAAYYTDTTTNRTEQRRFDVRLSKEPIHVYMVNRGYEHHPNLPFSAYVSTFYADGRPAVCDVEVRGRKNYAGVETATTTLQHLKTNSLGAARLEFFRPKFESVNDDLDLQITARDGDGRIGTFAEEIRFDEADRLRIQLEKTIYKPGESIKINVLSSKKDGFAYVDVTLPNRTVVESRFVKLANGRAEIKIPYNQKFKGDLIVAAYSDNEARSYYDRNECDARGIIYPAQQNLQLSAEFSADVYKPNEEGKINFSVVDGSGKAVESALGVVIFDKAIEERARTDAEFGSYFGQFGRLLGYDKSFGSVTLKDINELDLSKSVSGEMQLAAEIMLAGSYYYPRISHSAFNRTEAAGVYAEFFKKQLAPLENALKNHYARTYDHPVDDVSLRKILSENDLNLDQLRDPWGQNYYAVFTIDKTQDIFTLRTAGADKKPGTPDDFNVSSAGYTYFALLGRAIDGAIENYHRQTGEYVRNRLALADALARQKLDLSRIKDRWNRDYQIEFKIYGRKYEVVFHSNGPDGIYQTSNWGTDDFDVWKSEIDYFAETEKRINQAFSETVNAGKKSFPASEAEFAEMLGEKGIDLAQIRDGFGEPVYLALRKYSRFDDKSRIDNGKQTLLPVTQEMAAFTLRSKGSDRILSMDDFDLAEISGVVAEQSRETNYSRAEVKTVTFFGTEGAIRGTVLDKNGAIVPNAQATAVGADGKTYTATTDENGVFLLENLPSGIYRVTVASGGFMDMVYSNIQVRSRNLVEMKVTLEVGSVSATVDVDSGASMSVDVSDSKIETNITQSSVEMLPKGVSFSSILKISPKEKGASVTAREENSTPRLREYFPETLLWLPEVVTDRNGRAELKFKLADNITTWKLYTIASTKNGKIGVVEKEVAAFQPFFVDLDPPKFLTAGDEISLPVQVRNYTDAKQKVKVSMADGEWFSFLNPASRQIEVAPDSSENAVFGFRAISAVKDGKQKVTAVAAKDSDAVEKPVTVRPNGREIVRAESQFFRDAAAFDINFPAGALPRTQKAELKIYPNLLSHVTESVEGLLQRPYGCGEQTTSSTYPNLMILKFIKSDSNLRQTAQKYLQKGYERLLGYQAADGGFSYWGGKDASDVALTAYVLRFLSDAKNFIEVDETVVKRAQGWLAGQQKPDGSWTKKYYWETTEDAGRTKLFTSYVARTLAMSKQKDGAILQKALAYLKTRNAEIDEPYALALYGLASLDAGDTAAAGEIAARLEKMAIPENDAVYWKLETNTPFYGWGTAGRVETTALVLQLLIREAQTGQTENAERDRLISRATLFLLKNKDRYGVWYSTQTTINVLDAFLASLAENSPSENQTLQIFLNGANLQNISVAGDEVKVINLDLTGKLNPAANRLEIKNPAGTNVMAQIVSSHYIDWLDADRPAESKFLRLDYKCDKAEARIMEEINCAVEAERIGFNGYGMLLAEIGLPPGADVSRESLEKAMRADWSLSRYDILPDRIVLYMWSKAGGTKFNFKFRPRYGINAQTPASTVYDYYNEEARATLAPMRFEVK
jgi:hypothetical protein